MNEPRFSSCFIEKRGLLRAKNLFLCKAEILLLIGNYFINVVL